MTRTSYKSQFRNGRRFVRFFAALAAVLTLTCVFSGGPEYAADAQTGAQHPVLLELFTSEGCSSCPPVDDWAKRLDSTQPLAGSQIIVLSEHVDYWDHDGWKDPYSSALLTERQRAYGQKLGLRDVYTPQVILDGSTEVHLNDQNQVDHDFARAAATAPAVSVRIDSIEIEAGKPGILRGRVAVDANPQERGDVYVATALDHAESDVLKGENGGHHLSYVAVVEDLTKIGKLEKGKSFEHDFSVKLKQGVDAKNLRIIAFVQEPDYGKVIGAAMEKNVP